MLTLVIPVYNMERLLKRCMDTMLAQTCRDFEIILVDDGSTDGSGALCDAYAAAHPDFIRVIHKPNGGLSTARNTGIDAAKGEFIIFPDPDDWVEPDYVRYLLQLQREHQADLVCTGYYIAADGVSKPGSADGEPTLLSGPQARKGLLLPPRMNGFAWNKLYRLSIIRAQGLRFLDNTGTTEDLDFVYRYLAHGERVCHAPALRTYHYYQRPGAATHSGFSRKKLENLHTYQKIMDDSAAWCPELKAAAEEELCVTAVNLLWAWEMGDRRDRESRRILLNSIRRYLPGHLRSHRYGTGRKLQALTAAISPRLFARLKNAVQK